MRTSLRGRQAHPFSERGPDGLPLDAAPDVPGLIQSRNLDLVGPKYRDPSSRRYVRILPAESKSWVDAVLIAPSVGRLQEQGLLTEFHVESSAMRLSFGPGRIVISPDHGERIDSARLDRATLLRCAAIWLRVNRALLEDGLALMDAHLENFVVDERMRPIWIDEGSIVPVASGLEGIREYLEFHHLPLWMAAHRPAVGTLLHGRRTPPSVAVESVGPLRGRMLEDAFRLAVSIERRGRYGGGVVRRARLRIRSLLLARLDAHLRRLERRLGGVAVLDDGAAPDGTVLDLAERLDGRSVIAVGAGAIRLLEDLGGVTSTQIAISMDDAALSRYSSWSVRRGVEETSTRRVFRGSMPDADLADIRAEVVIALDVVESTVLEESFPFWWLARMLAQLSTGSCIVGFPTLQDRADGSCRTPDWFRVENLLLALEREFGSAIVLGSIGGADSTILLLASHRVEDGAVDAPGRLGDLDDRVMPGEHRGSMAPPEG